jgi:hypothetical protein
MREDSIREFGRLREDMIKAQHTTNKIMLGTAGTVVVGVLSAIATMIMYLT